MSNLVQTLAADIADLGKWISTTIKEVVNTAVKVDKILKAEKPLEAPFVAGLSTVIADLEALIAASDSALSAKGLNFPADSQTYHQFITLVADFKKLASVVEEGVEILEGKPVAAAAPVPAAKSTVTAA